MATKKDMNALQAEKLVVQLLAELGNLYLELERYDEAIAKYRSLLDFDENNAAALLNLSRAYIKKQKFDKEALKILKRALQFNQDDEEVLTALCEHYLKEKKRDEEAIEVYAGALKKRKGERFWNKGREIIHILVQEKNHEKVFEFLNFFRDSEAEFRDLGAIYLKEAWENKSYEQAMPFLTKLMEEEKNHLWSYLYLANLYKLACSSRDSVKLTTTDLEKFKSLTEERKVFDCLAEVYHFLAVNRLFQRFPIRTDTGSRPAIEEYELFISGDTFSNIWDLGLNKREISGANLGFDDKIVLEKMRILAETPNISEVVDEITKEANSLFALRCEGGNLPILKKTLKNLLENHSAKDARILQAFEVKDGVVVFSNNVEKLISVVKKLLKKHRQLDEQNGKNKSAMEVIVTTIALTKDRHSKYLFDDLELALSLFARDETFLFADRLKHVYDIKITNQVYITESVKNILSEKSDVIAVPASFSLTHPVSEEKINIFKINIHDTFDKIENGEIKSIGKFKVDQELHQNQIFSSFKAIDSALERLVILKVLRPEFEINEDPELTKKLFTEEARKLGKLTHPNVAQIYEIGEDHQLQFVAREYVDGKPLSSYMQNGNGMEWKSSLRLCIQLAEILSAMHKRNIIHGRLKPNNIFLLDKMELKLTDFQLKGFSMPIRDLENVPLQFLTYSPPELLDLSEATEQTDIYSLGVIIYELLAGCNPFLNGKRETVLNHILTRVPEPISRINSAVPKEIDKVVLRALEKAPVNRYADMKSLIKDLKELVKN